MTAGGNSLLLSAGGDLGLNAAVTAAASGAAVSLLAGGSAQIDAAVSATGAGATVDVLAGGAVRLGSAGSLAAGDQLRVAAGTDIALGQAGSLNAPTAVSLLAGGSISGAPGAGTDIRSAALRLNAGAGIGSATERLETAVATVSARAAGGGIWLQAADALTIGDVSATVRRVAADGSTTLVSDAPQSDLVTTAGNGHIAVRTLNGNIVLADGSAPADGRSVSANGSGTVTLSVAGAGAVLAIHNDALTQQGPVLIDSPLQLDGSFTITAGVGGAAADGNVTLQGAINGQAGGAADRLSITSDGGFVHVLGAIGGAQPLAGISIRGAGDVRFEQAVHLAGDFLIEASGAVVFAGGLLLDAGTLHIVGASQVVLGDVVLGSGDLLIDASGAVTFNNGLQIMQGRLVVNSSGDLQFTQAAQVAAGVVLHSAGAVQFSQALTVAQGGLQVDARGAIGFGGAVQVAGSVALDTLGAVHFDAGLVVAQGGLQVDTLGDVHFGAAVQLAGALVINTAGAVAFGAGLSVAQGGLQIDTQGDVGWAGPVQVVGDVAIDTPGAVVAGGALRVDGGDLRIDGAASVVLGDTSVTGGDVAIRAAALRLDGPLRGSAGGSLHITPLAADGEIRIGGAAVAGGALQLDGASLSQVRDFGQVSIGQPGGGAVFIDPQALAGLGAAQLNVSGSRIDIVGGSGAGGNGNSDNGTLVVTDRVVLQAAHDITVTGRLALGAVGADLLLASGAAITMRPDALLMTRGGELTLQSQGNLALGLLDTRNGADPAAAGGVLLVSHGGTISDAAADEALNVQAGWLVMRGRGPLLAAGQTTAAAAIDVAVERLDIDDRSGLMLRDTGTDGRTRFNLLSGGLLYQQMVATGGPLRTAAALIGDNSALSAGGQAQIAAWMAAMRPLSELREASSAQRSALTSLDAALPASSAAAGYLAALTAGDGSALSASGSANPGAGTANALQQGPNGLLQMSAEALLADASFGLAQRLEQAWLLGSSSQQPAATGQQSLGSPRFDIWEDSLAL